MNIDGLGDRIIEDLYNMKYVLNIDDFYHLEKHKDDLKLLEVMVKKVWKIYLIPLKTLNIIV